MSTLRWPAAVLLLLALAACQSFPTQQFNKAANPNLHTIAIAPIGMPEKPQVVILNAVGNNFGLIGALVEAGRASEASKEAEANFSAAGVDYQTYLPRRLQESMQSLGMQIRQLSGSRPADERFKFLTKLPDAQGADAVLDMYVSYLGYAAAGATTDYRPAVHVEAKLIDPVSKKVLFADQIYYNNYNPQFAKTAQTIEPDLKMTFKDRDAMKAAPAQVAQGVREGIDAVALALAKQFQ
jgi:hypothetical protein